MRGTGYLLKAIAGDRSDSFVSEYLTAANKFALLVPSCGSTRGRIIRSDSKAYCEKVVTFEYSSVYSYSFLCDSVSDTLCLRCRIRGLFFPEKVNMVVRDNSSRPHTTPFHKLANEFPVLSRPSCTRET